MKIKFLVITAVLATAILCSAGFANAQNVDNSTLIAQLQQQIAQLQAQLQQLIAQQGGTTQAWCYNFNTNMGVANVVNNDTVNLNIALQKSGFTPLHSDMYSEGMAAEVVQFQAKYGITPQSGYVGPLTRAKLNSLYGCGVTPAPTPTCTPNWRCTWSPCQNGVSTQYANDLAACGLPQSSANIACPALAKQCNATQPSIIVRAPTGGDTWQIGTQQVISYDFSNIGPAGTCVDAFLVNSSANKTPLTVGNYIGRNGDTLTFNLGSGSSSNIQPGTYNVELDAHYCAETNNAFITSGTSNGYVTIVAPTTQPSITVTSPKAGYAWNIGGTYAITWTSSNIPSSHPLTAQLMTAAGTDAGIYINSLQLNGSSGWIVPSTLSPGRYKWVIFDPAIGNSLAGNFAFGQSDIFTIVAPNTNQPSITVTSPNGGSLTVGQPTTITWNTTGFSPSDTVSISLFNSTTSCPANSTGCWTAFPISNVTLKNTGSYTWDTNTYYGDGGPGNPIYLSQAKNLPTGAVYKFNITINSSSGATAFGSSANYFSIVAP